MPMIAVMSVAVTPARRSACQRGSSAEQTSSGIALPLVDRLVVRLDVLRADLHALARAASGLGNVDLVGHVPFSRVRVVVAVLVGDVVVGRAGVLAPAAGGALAG